MRRIAAVLQIVALLLITVQVPADAAQPAADAEQLLAERYAPVIMIKEQEQECDDKGEPYLPTSVDIVLDNPQVMLREHSSGNPVVKRAPGAADLVGLGEGFFLDFPGEALTPGCLYEKDFRRYQATRPATIYAHIVEQDDAVYLQYWFYWYFNDWNNKHESDWEGIVVKFDVSSVDDALRTEPVAVGYNQHDGGERADWDDDKLEKQGTHPVVYSSAGSHASYFSSDLFLGRGDGEGLGCDNTAGPSNPIRPVVVVLPDAVADPTDPLAWLSYEGRWGEHLGKPNNGPTGPNSKGSWTDPGPGFDNLRDGSVLVPTGASQAAVVVSAFCTVVEYGSKGLYTFTHSPVQLLLGLLIVGAIARFLVHRTDWRPVSATPLARRRRGGQILVAAKRLYLEQPGTFLLFGLVYLPAAFLTGALAAVISLVPPVRALLDMSDGLSGADFILTALVGSIGHTAAFLLVNSLVADHLGFEVRGPVGAAITARRVTAQVKHLAGAFIRSYLIVAGLFLSFIGIPWAIRQLVRYQFIGHAVVLQGAEANTALEASSVLVRHRWFHTAGAVAAINFVLELSALAVLLLVLVTLTEIPLWTFSAVALLIHAILVPMASIVMYLLYGDAVAQHEKLPQAEPAAL